MHEEQRTKNKELNQIMCRSVQVVYCTVFGNLAYDATGRLQGLLRFSKKWYCCTACMHAEVFRIFNYR